MIRVTHRWRAENDKQGLRRRLRRHLVNNQGTVEETELYGRWYTEA
jgi:hypothetical protein